MNAKKTSFRNLWRLGIVAGITLLLLVVLILPLAPDASARAGGLRKSTITITVASSSVGVGNSVHASCSLIGTKPIAGATVSLSVTMPSGATAYPTQGPQTTTDQSGRFNIDYTPTIVGIYQLTVTYAGDNKYLSASSSASFLSMGPIQPTKSATNLTLTTTALTVDIGASMHADGLLSSVAGIPGAAVDLKVALPDGTSTTPAQGGLTSTDANGRFAMDFTPSIAGTYGYTATYEGNDVYGPCTTTVSFDAVSRDAPAQSGSSIILTLASSSIETGRSMHAEGLAKSTVPIANVPVNLLVTLPGGNTAYPVQGELVTTDSLGKFAMDYVPMKAGTYEFSATFSGNDQFEGSSISATFSALDPGLDASYKYIVSSVGGTYFAKTPEGSTISSGTNAATVINRALNALTPDRTAKEKVQLQGSFSLTSQINIQSYSFLEVADGGKLIWGTSSTGYMLFASGKSNFEIAGGDWDKAQVLSSPFEFVACTDVVIRDLSVHEIQYDGIRFSGSNRVTISNVEVGNVGHTAIVMAACNDCVIENCHLHDCGAGGCYFYCEAQGVQTVNNNILRGNLVERTQLSGLSLASLRGVEDIGTNNLAEYNTLVDCGMDGAHPGIACGWGENKATYCIIRYNTIYETKTFWPPAGNGSEAGLGLSCDDSQVYGNIIYDIYDGGIYLLGDRNRIHDNQISGASSAGYGGMWLSSASNNEILNNTFKNCPVGLRLTGTSNDNHIANNSFEDMDNYLVLVSGAANVIENNTYRGTGSIYDGGTGTIIRNNTQKND